MSSFIDSAKIACLFRAWHSDSTRQASSLMELFFFRSGTGNKHVESTVKERTAEWCLLWEKDEAVSLKGGVPLERVAGKDSLWDWTPVGKSGTDFW